VSTAYFQPTLASNDDIGFLLTSDVTFETERVPSVRWKFLTTLSAVATVLNGASPPTPIAVKNVHREVFRPTSARYASEDWAIEEAGVIAPGVDAARPKAISGQKIRRAVEDLVEWLGMTRGDIATVGGFNRRSISNWTTKGAYPATVRHLLGVHSYVSAVVDALGVEGARQYIAMQAGGEWEEPASVVEMLRDQSRVGELISGAAGFLFASAPRQSQFADLALEDDVEVAAPNPKPTDRGRRSPIRVSPKPVRRD
jgi:hypothetical protein